MPRRVSSTWPHSVVTFLSFCRTNWVLLIILAVGVAIRWYKLGVIPPGLNQDEASLAYDAYALLRYGVERNGFSYPVMLIAYGSGMSGTIAAYLMWPFLVLFGLTITSARLLFAVAGSISLLIAYAVGLQLGGKRLGLLSAILLALNPWHIGISRWALDCNLLPTFFLLGVFLLLRAAQRPTLLPVAMVVFSLSFYSYGTAYIMVPLFLALCCSYLVFHRRVRWRWLLVSVVTGVSCVLPLGLFLVANKWELPSFSIGPVSFPNLPTTPRYEAATSLFGAGALADVGRNLRVLWQLLLTQSDGLIWNSFQPYGILYIFGLFVAAVGFFFTLRRSARRAYDPHTLLIFWLVSAICLSAVMEVNINRINVLFPCLIFFMAVAIDALWRWRVIAITLLTLYFFSAAQFTYAYFTTYPDQIGPIFFSSFDDALRVATDRTTGTVCITNQVSMAEVSVLFHNRLPPERFYRTVAYADPHALYRHARSFDRYVFGLENCPADSSAYIVHTSEIPPLSSEYRWQYFRYYAVAIRQP